ncbi:4'-phosphopantetheinyl transferase superfamily protein [Psychrobacter sp. HD31]|uniref:4'-phosphopantetheinyl transferase superfamily protein n=1 Tax=Psychrobacter sp. HD31 TaxID=3112003 RepID=UPI003DA4A091
MRLKKIKFFQLNQHTWLASAFVNQIINVEDKTQIQKKAVRYLLDELVEHLSLCKKLDESKYPYQLISTQKFVCFTHSHNQVAVIISSQNAGVDIELKAIPQRVINRYYHKDETSYLSAKTLLEQETLSRWLWQYKECMVKIKQCTLAQSLGMNNLDVLKQIEQTLNANKGTNLRAMIIKSSDKTAGNAQNIWINRENNILAIYRS